MVSKRGGRWARIRAYFRQRRVVREHIRRLRDQNRMDRAAQKMYDLNLKEQELDRHIESYRSLGARLEESEARVSLRKHKIRTLKHQHYTYKLRERMQ